MFLELRYWISMDTCFVDVWLHTHTGSVGMSCLSILDGLDFPISWLDFDDWGEKFCESFKLPNPSKLTCISLSVVLSAF